MQCKDCKLAEKQELIFKRHKTGKQVNIGIYHYCPLVDDNSEIYPDDMDCINEEAYNNLLAERQG